MSISGSLTAALVRRPCTLFKTDNVRFHMRREIPCRILSRVITQHAHGRTKNLVPLCSSSSREVDGNEKIEALDEVKCAQREASSRLPRFFHSEPLPRCAGARTILSAGESKHALRSLRLSEGALLELCDGRGQLSTVRVISTGKKGAEVEAVEEPREAPVEGAQWEVVVACGSLKGGRVDWLVEKCSELGAQAFTPLLSERSGVMSGGRSDRLERVALAAAKQSLRSRILQVSEPESLSALVGRLEEEVRQEGRVVLLAAAGAKPVLQVVQQIQGGISVGGLIIIGPEGDFTPDEVEALVAAGATPVGLGPLRLRAETAAIALLSGLMLIDA